MTTNLEILEVEYSCSPGGVDTFEVYDIGQNADLMSPPIFSSELLTEAVSFCYNLGQDFTVKTLAQYNREAEQWI